MLRFQEDRVATSKTVAFYKGKLDPSKKLSSLSLCGRFFLFTLHGWATFFALLNEEYMKGILEAGEWCPLRLWKPKKESTMAQGLATCWSKYI